MKILENVGIISTFRPPLMRGTSPKHAVLTPLGAIAVTGWLDERHAARTPRTRPYASPLAPTFITCSASTTSSALWPAPLGRPLMPNSNCGGPNAPAPAPGERSSGPMASDAGAKVVAVSTSSSSTTPASKGLRQVTAKLPGYAALADSTGYTSPVLFWLHSARREKELHRKLAATLPRVPVATASGDPATTDPSGLIWRIMGTERRASLIDLDRLGTSRT